MKSKLIIYVVDIHFPCISTISGIRIIKSLEGMSIIP